MKFGTVQLRVVELYQQKPPLNEILRNIQRGFQIILSAQQIALLTPQCLEMLLQPVP